MANGIRIGNPRGFNKGHTSKFCEGYRVQQTPEEGRRTYRPKHCGNNNKDEDNSPKILNDKNHKNIFWTFHLVSHRQTSPHGIMAKVPYSGLEKSKFELQSCYYPWKRYEPLYFPPTSYGLNSTSIILLQGWFFGPHAGHENIKGNIVNNMKPHK